MAVVVAKGRGFRGFRGTSGTKRRVCAAVSAPERPGLSAPSGRLTSYDAVEGGAAPDRQSLNQMVEEEMAMASRTSSLRLSLHKADFTVNSLVDKINRNKLDLRPAYQREFVWNKTTSSKLIESLLLNVPVPTLFFHETDRGLLEVVDGKQRLTSIYSYVTGSFPDETPFKLSGLDVFEELNGCFFEDLSEEQQETIKDFALNVHTITRGCEPDFVFEVFERLNMGATQLNEQELRNCIYIGPYTELLERAVRLPTMLQIMHANEPHMRMKDKELVLRFFAMQRSSHNGFRMPIKSWLNEEIRTNQYLLESEMDAMLDIFEASIALAHEIFGDNVFRTVKKANMVSQLMGGNVQESKGEINVALWDTLLYAISKRLRPGIRERMIAKKEDIRQAWLNLLVDQRFTKLLVSNPKAVIQRFEILEEEFDNILVKSIVD